MSVKMKKCVIDGQSVHSLEQLYGELARQLPFPSHFGNNLDALWDVLTTDIKGPVQLAWNSAGVSRLSMGSDFEKAVALLQQVGKERKDFQVIIQE